MGHGTLLKIFDSVVASLAAAKNNQAVSMSGQPPQVRMVLMCEKDPDLAREPLEKQHHEENVVVLRNQAKLEHVRQQL